MAETLNIYQKIAKIRNTVNVKKKPVTIWNKKRNCYEERYTAYKIDDIMEASKLEMQEIGLATTFNMQMLPKAEYGNQDIFRCVLKVVNVDNPSETETFSIDIIKSAVIGANEAQNSGGTRTYAEKYCMSSFLMLSDSELDPDQSHNHDDEKTTPQKPEKVDGKDIPTYQEISKKEDTPKQILELHLRNEGLNPDEMLKFIRQQIGTDKITQEQAGVLYDRIIAGEVSIELEDDVPNHAPEKPVRVIK